MSTTPSGSPGSEKSSWSPAKQYEVTNPKTKAFMVEDAQWERIQERVSSLEAKAGIDWLIALATMMGGIAVSALIALLVLPKATKSGTHLSPFVRPTLWVVFVGATILAVVTSVLWRRFRSEQTDVAADICAEMNTIQEAWKDRKAAPVAEV